MESKKPYRDPQLPETAQETFVRKTREWQKAPASPGVCEDCGYGHSLVRRIGVSRYCKEHFWQRI